MGRSMIHGCFDGSLELLRTSVPDLLFVGAIYHIIQYRIYAADDRHICFYPLYQKIRTADGEIFSGSFCKNGIWNACGVIHQN